MRFQKSGGFLSNLKKNKNKKLYMNNWIKKQKYKVLRLPTRAGGGGKGGARGG